MFGSEGNRRGAINLSRAALTKLSTGSGPGRFFLRIHVTDFGRFGGVPWLG
jgi:hypothetical protein